MKKIILALSLAIMLIFMFSLSNQSFAKKASKKADVSKSEEAEVEKAVEGLVWEGVKEEGLKEFKQKFEDIQKDVQDCLNKLDDKEKEKKSKKIIKLAGEIENAKSFSDGRPIFEKIFKVYKSIGVDKKKVDELDELLLGLQIVEEASKQDKSIEEAFWSVVGQEAEKEFLEKFEDITKDAADNIAKLPEKQKNKKVKEMEKLGKDLMAVKTIEKVKSTFKKAVKFFKSVDVDKKKIKELEDIFNGLVAMEESSKSVAKAKKIKIKCKALNVRENPDLKESKILWVVVNGEEFDVIEIKNGFYKIEAKVVNKYNGGEQEVKTGWISGKSKYVTILK